MSELDRLPLSFSAVRQSDRSILSSLGYQVLRQYLYDYKIRQQLQVSHERHLRALIGSLVVKNDSGNSKRLLLGHNFYFSGAQYYFLVGPGKYCFRSV